jgi:hypothetical protein
MRITVAKVRPASILALAGVAALMVTAPAFAQAPAPAPSETLSAAGSLPYAGYAEPPEDAEAPSGMRFDPLLGPVPNDGKIHGMVSVGVGTNGYRDGAAAISGPLPNGGNLSMAVESSQMQYRGRSRYFGSPLQPPLLAPDAP